MCVPYNAPLCGIPVLVGLIFVTCLYILSTFMSECGIEAAVEIHFSMCLCLPSCIVYTYSHSLLPLDSL